jgi:hypothetical protein
VRSGWIGWQGSLFANNPRFERGYAESGVYGPGPRFRLQACAGPRDLTFGSLGYADAAINSYRDFQRLQRAGALPSHMRFQVSLPTPLAPVSTFVALYDRAVVEAVYEQRLLAELADIVTRVPSQRLSIQWDVAAEVAILEAGVSTHLRNPRADIVERLVRLGRAVPADVELGYHFCYGDRGHRHFKQPEDTRLVVRLANEVAARLARRLTWIHLPVPIARDDDAYFAPLRELQPGGETEVYLGLIHYHDGLAGAERRIEAAQRHLANFGVATECGLGRRPADTVAELLRLHADVTARAIR